MNKKELIAAIAEKAEITKKDATTLLDALTDIITECLSNGDEVKISGFGTFTTSERAARECRNPLTGESISVDAKVVPKFKASATLKQTVNA